MSPLAKKLALILYFGIAGAIFINYLMGLGWFGRYDKIVMWGFVAVAALVGSRLKARAEKKARGGEVLVEALDAQGAVRSDPGARRFIWTAVSIALGLILFIILAQAYRDLNQRGTTTYVLATVVILIVVWIVFRSRFGNISDVEDDDGITLTLRRRRETIRVPWSEIESVEVSRPYSFWQVMLKFRRLGESKTQTVRFLPFGWRKMTPPAAEKLQAALDQRRATQ